MVSLMVILFKAKCFMFVYIYVDLLKLKAYKLFENIDADLSWLLFKEANLFNNISIYQVVSDWLIAIYVEMLKITD